MTFEVWMKKVDEIVSIKCGFGCDDLADMCYLYSFEGGVTPAAMARKVFADKGVNLVKSGRGQTRLFT